MANIQKIGSNTWRISKMYKRVRYTKIVHRKPSKAEAERLIWMEIEKEPEHGVYGTFETAADDYFSSMDSILHPSTLRNYKSMLQNMPVAFKNKAISGITPVDVQSCLNLYASAHAAKSVRNLSGFISCVMKSQRPSFEAHPVLPKVHSPEFYVPEDSDVRAILEAIKGSKFEVPIWLAILGLRRSEICALTIDDLDGNMLTISKGKTMGPDGEWTINTPKTRESVRTIRVPDYVADLIRAQGYVYDGHPNSINMYLTRLQKRLGLPHFSLHKFRHFFASTAREIMSDDYVEKLGGWRPGSPIMKKVYSYAKKKQEAAANEAYISKLSGLI